MSVVGTFNEEGELVSVGKGEFSERKRNDDRTVPRSVQVALDLLESNKEFKVVSDVPGVDPAHLDVWLDGRLLSIRAKRDEVYNETVQNKLSRGICYGNIEGHVRLPNNASLDQAKAEYKHGVLAVYFPNTEWEETSVQRRLPINTA
jgi:HSP20 family protein